LAARPADERNSHFTGTRVKGRKLIEADLLTSWQMIFLVQLVAFMPDSFNRLLREPPSEGI
jgi:hypothetical protein